ncbi:PQQ-dependent catabolism-associated CXXCW motif protein [Inhella inkyongensis]|uniref:PQQ-dependent catabolism-associated CXXCW motif protein n=1 Tax=Inhella inkyongensis TaxID=392593 RepID=A0A840S9I0_9BURK|nr:rhodanese-like domain-containing protein [Inhella inkyongensis]MBB5206293.1 PQQ-dependent catabolism-associated CXXCW motif protein [Inhella inkyongensis]
MAPPLEAHFANEEIDHGLKVEPKLRNGTNIHAPTPTNAPNGAKTINTKDLVLMYRNRGNKPLVLDVLQNAALSRQTLPEAVWLSGAGWEAESVNPEIERNLIAAMKQLAPSKDKPVVTYCLNHDCWLSWNAAMRLAKIGYKNVFWYRGGIQSWRAAGLPVIETPLGAHLY